MTLQYGTIDSAIWLDSDSTSVGPSVAFDGPLWQINAFTWQGDSTNNVPGQEVRLLFDGIESGGVHEDVRIEIELVAGEDIYEAEGTVEVSFVSFVSFCLPSSSFVGSCLQTEREKERHPHSVNFKSRSLNF